MTPPFINGVAATVDPGFKGSVFEKMECFSHWVCPHCNAHLSDSLICLNGCHMPQRTREKFNRLMTSAAKATGRK
ncbi:MAG: hypothetical protein B9S32_13725 [Verrucomicrobia bacterium Tous-C9LFEB]|nr:MAG: hypothetical protein B9S32_13725 [Verrucomicrobia bacterium Tous-C9LFEB]